MVDFNHTHIETDHRITDKYRMQEFLYIPYDQLTPSQYARFIDFLKNDCVDPKKPAHVNMWHDDWKNQPHTLMYLLKKSDRFNGGNGRYFIMMKQDGEIVACSGIYRSNFDWRLGLCATRTWVKDGYRHINAIALHLLPVQKRWAYEQECSAVGICVNEYNKNLLKVYKRARMGEDPSRLKPQDKYGAFYHGVNEVMFPVNIQNTKQWIYYEKLDPLYEFDWESIRYKD